MADRRRILIAIYVVMAIAVAIVAPIVFKAGQDLTPEHSVAGGYDLERPDRCLGPSFDIRQSGEFANIENAAGSLGGAIRVESGRLTGSVSCIAGGSDELRATSSERALEGTIGGRPLKAALTRDPPPPGPRPRAPGSIAGDYVLKPPSPCLGSKLTIEGSGPRLRARARRDRPGHGPLRGGPAEGPGPLPRRLHRTGRGQRRRSDDHDAGGRRQCHGGEAARGGEPLRGVLHSRRRRDAAGPAVRDGVREDRAAAGDGRGARRHRARPHRGRHAAGRTSNPPCSRATSSPTSGWSPSSA